MDVRGSGLFPALAVFAVLATGCGGRVFGAGVHSPTDAEKYMVDHVLLGLNTPIRCATAAKDWTYACTYTDRRWVAITGTTHVKVGLLVRRAHVEGVSGVVVASEPLPPRLPTIDGFQPIQ